MSQIKNTEHLFDSCLLTILVRYSCHCNKYSIRIWHKVDGKNLPLNILLLATYIMKPLHTPDTGVVFKERTLCSIFFFLELRWCWMLLWRRNAWLLPYPLLCFIYIYIYIYMIYICNESILLSILLKLRHGFWLHLCDLAIKIKSIINDLFF